MKTTLKQEKFAGNLFVGMSLVQSYVEAGYSNKQAPHTLKANAFKLSKSNYVLTTINNLKKRAESAKIATVQERQERLSEIIRARLTDFMELGQDGSWVNIGKETPGGAAIQEIHSRTEYDEDGSKPTVYTSVKLHDPIKAIDLLNKMDKLYSEGTTVNIDNRRAEIVVMSENTKKLVERVLDGEGTITR